MCAIYLLKRDQMTTTKKRILIVLGMHRSGTSVLTKGLEVFSVNFGDNLMRAANDNIKGFWEDNEVVDINNAALKFLGASWHSIISPIKEIDLSSRNFKLLVTRAEELLSCRLQGKDIWGFKDPRTCRTLPIWQQAFENYGCEPSFIIANRNPLEVARSLEHRNGIPKALSNALWAQHTSLSLVHSSRHKRIVVEYDNLLSDPLVQIDRIANALALPFAGKEQAEFQEYTERFIDGGLKHHTLTVQDLLLDDATPDFVKELYLSLRAAGKDLIPVDSNRIQEAIRATDEESSSSHQILNVLNSVSTAQISSHSTVIKHEDKLSSLDIKLDSYKTQIQQTIRNHKSEITEKLSAKNAENEKLRKELAHQSQRAEDFRKTQEKQILQSLNRFSRKLRRLHKGQIKALDDILMSTRFRLGDKIARSLTIDKRRVDAKATAEKLERRCLAQERKIKNEKNRTIRPSWLLDSPIFSQTTHIGIEKEIGNAVANLGDLQHLIEGYEEIINQVTASRRYRLGSFLLNGLYKRIVLASNRSAKWAPESAKEIYREYLSWKECQRELEETYHQMLSDQTQIQYKKKNAKGLDTDRKYSADESSKTSHNQAGLSRPTGTTNGKSTSFSISAIDDIRIIQCTPKKVSNPYYSMIPEELGRQGLDVVYSTDMSEIKSLIKAGGYTKQILHLHQLEPLYHSKTGSKTETIETASKLIENLFELKNLGAVLVWTKHNPLPHNRQFSDIDYDLIRVVSNLVDRILTLGEVARKEMTIYVPEDKIGVFRHPSFEGIYGARVPSSDARASYELSANDFIFGIFGEIKPYKGLEFIIRGFKQLNKISGNQNTKLFIAGPAASVSYAEELQKLAGTSDVILHPHRIANEDIPQILACFDVSVFAFKAIWASSSVILSLSYGVPVIIPRLGCLTEYVLEGNHGLTYEPANEKDFVKMLQVAKEGATLDHLKCMCDEFNVTHNLENLVETLKTEYWRAANGHL